MKTHNLINRSVWMSSALLLTIPTVLRAELNDTGITYCSNATTNGLTCSIMGFPGQDAEHGRDAPCMCDFGGFDFTPLDKDGNDKTLTGTTTNPYPCVRDNVTGLVWQVHTDDGTLYDKDWKSTYDNSSVCTTTTGTPPAPVTPATCNNTQYIADVNTNKLCGFSDWRVPTVKELFGLIRHGTSNPAIETQYFPNTISEEFWTSSLDASDTTKAWYVKFTDGHAQKDVKTKALRIRLVRGTTAADNFVDNGNGTVTQTNNNLMWAKCSEGQDVTTCTGTATPMNWATGLVTASNSSLANYTDWRLPNIKELQALVNYSNTAAPMLTTATFPSTPTDNQFWSSSPRVISKDTWDVDFNSGVPYFNSRLTTTQHYIRLVRDVAISNNFTVTVNLTGSGSGTVTSADDSIDCGTKCDASLNSGSSIDLIATAAAGSVFTGWSGGCTGTGTCSGMITAAQTVTANFDRAYKLSTSLVGSGSIQSTCPDTTGINCLHDCTENYAQGTEITLEAIPNPGATLKYWQNDACRGSKALTCTFIMEKDEHVSAHFYSASTLTVNVTGSGAVYSSPAGISCNQNSDTCERSYRTGQKVVLTAYPSRGYTIDWDNYCNGTGQTLSKRKRTCTVTMSENQDVTVPFVE